ncbi:MAG TPA: DoxX family protein [Herpetosiphonaceae bacterium]
MLKRLYSYNDTLGSVGLLVLRLVVGSAFVLHGLPKIQKPFNWMGDAFPGFLQALAAIAEFGGGLALILGLLTPVAMLGLICTMVVAVFTHVMRGDPWVGQGGSFELPALYLIVALTIALLGPGRFSLDALLLNKASGSAGFSRLVRQSQE